jgi:hypothetical protein
MSYRFMAFEHPMSTTHPAGALVATTGSRPQRNIGWSSSLLDADLRRFISRPASLGHSIDRGLFPESAQRTLLGTPSVTPVPQSVHHRLFRDWTHIKDYVWPRCPDEVADHLPCSTDRRQPGLPVRRTPGPPHSGTAKRHRPAARLTFTAPTPHT